MPYTVFIPCAGLGSRLGDLTRYLPKALVSVGLQPAISRVLNQFPADTRFVIAVGYQGELLKEYLNLVHSGLRIDTVDVECFEGSGSGLGHTLKCASYLLQEPFVFCSCDTLVQGEIPPPDHNWAAWSETPLELDSFRTLNLDPVSGSVIGVLEKGAHRADSRAYIGLCGIADWREFWSEINSDAPEVVTQGESYALQALCQKGVLKAYPFVWHDTGTPANLTAAVVAYRPEVQATILPKANEAIWFVDDQVIKFSNDVSFIANRVERVRHLQGFVPTLTASSKHLYCYRRVEGEVLSRVAQTTDLDRLLEHCDSFWRPTHLTESQSERFRGDCLKFYRDKTYERVELFYLNFRQHDNAFVVNGENMPTLASLLDSVDWHGLSDGMPGRFHGDFHFENILLTADGRFSFLDWRQDFCGELSYGDVYYDFAKLNHGLIVNHELISDGHYEARWVGQQLNFGFLRYQRLVECERAFSDWLNRRGHDVRKMRLLTALVYLNIAALHHAPYSLMLYGLGKRMLFQELKHAN